jgi:hypothetical protein
MKFLGCEILLLWLPLILKERYEGLIGLLFAQASEECCQSEVTLSFRPVWEHLCG